eukprot:CAMPEP_0179971930 /NCGR_PEP_ID=MMETSP0983-20121128/36324_1 /TAXON_ID=483367 /ORGANISM="non described non described, Strain CCMP 2436" /LENGTH=183 /DNA_ID=CAMNT_0021887155 /DNA_START=184 /DNA_END=736 /DNA_ORIENTATION=+
MCCASDVQRRLALQLEARVVQDAGAVREGLAEGITGERLVLPLLVGEVFLHAAGDPGREAEIDDAQESRENCGHKNPTADQDPTAADSQTEVAVVSPCTSGAELPFFCTVPFQIEAAPRNPTPEGMAAETRLESQPIGPSQKAKVESMVNTQLPMHTIAIVRMPAGLSARLRSQPMMDPSTIE